MTKKKKVIIIGAGPGGLSAGMILAHEGFDVQIYEKQNKVGGRNGHIQMGDYKFDIGPTFLMMLNVLEEVFEASGRKAEDYLTITELDPLYKLVFKEKTLYPSRNKEKMAEDIEKNFPGEGKNYRKYLERESIKYERLIPCLQVPYGSLTDYLSPRFMRSLPYLDAHKSLYDVMGEYFKDPILKTSFTFQAKYIGMSPWEAPGTFSIISFIEHSGGVFHVEGGIHKISEAMAKVIEECGGKIHLNSAVEEVIIENGKAIGIKVNGENIYSDYVIINADFANAMTKLIPEKHREKYNNRKLAKMDYSCSTFMLYLGVDKVYDNIEHHNIFFSHDYRNNVNEITQNHTISDDPSFYIQNASITDATLAPEGKSTIYVLVPVPNNKSGINWDAEKKVLRDKVIKLMETRAGLTDLSKHIQQELILTPADWENKLDVHFGATFNLAHTLGQMLYFRPHNEYEELENCYLVGGGTHPGSGLPTIYESGKISANLIINNYRGIK